MVVKKCSTCKFRASGNSANGCDYYFIHKKRRGCPVDNCDKYEKGPRMGIPRLWTEPVVVGHRNGDY